MLIERKRSISEQQQSFIDYLVKDNKNPTESARLAGYRHPKQSAYVLTRNPNIIHAIRLSRQTLYQTDLANLAVETLRSVMLDPDSSGSAKVSASRTVLELSGDLAKDRSGDLEGKSLGEMTTEELARVIGKLEEEKSSLARDITPDK
tara:strand:+ start:1927 stop:2370 length:444 start_codon:yes stop_codon:yes gene_type:complete